MKSIYLAGPDVFLPEFETLIAEKARLVQNCGFIPLYAGVIAYPQLPDRRRSGLVISAINELLMRGADAIIANLTPFRGLAADSGTVYELGFMAALGRPVFAYTNSKHDHHTRIKQYYGANISRDDVGQLRAADGTMIEDHDMTDNLMIDGGISHRAGEIVRGAYDDQPLNTDLTAFRACLEAADRALSN